MRLDHIAYRTRNRHKTSEFLQKAFGYTVVEEFEIDFGDGTKALSIAHAPPEIRHPDHKRWIYVAPLGINFAGPGDPIDVLHCEFHASPEIFVSDGKLGTIVGDWVASKNDGKGGLHHMAYQVKDIQDAINNWKKADVEFCSDEPMTCPGLKQIFTTEHELTGVIYELIEREGSNGKAFCKENVRALMESTLNTKK
jgi:catechol 2,3-dioxygenase-like lactoylglutathione lyase family enzyme